MFYVEQGIADPRTGDVSWRIWDATEDKQAALGRAKQLGIGRVVEAKELARFQDGKRVVLGEEPEAETRKRKGR